MGKLEYIAHLCFWTMWWLCSSAIAIVISEGVIMIFMRGLSPLFGSVSIWLAEHVWMFITMWIFLVMYHLTKIHLYSSEKYK